MPSNSQSLKKPSLISIFTAKFFAKNRHKRLRRTLMIATPYWIGASITAIIAIGYAKVFGWVESFAMKWIGANNPYVFLYTPLCFLLAWFIIRKISPEANGSGIPQLITAIELTHTKKPHPFVGKLLNIKVIIAKISSSIAILLGGGATGREGPTLQIAGSVFSEISNRMPSFWPKVNKKLMITAGGAAGIAAAFNTPLGGIVFSIEELAKMHISHFRTAVVTAVIIAGVISQWVLGNYLYLGYPTVADFGANILFISILVAGLGGIAGTFMGKIIISINQFRNAIKNAYRQAFFVLVCGVLFALILYGFGTEVAGPGKETMTRYLFETNPTVNYNSFWLRFIGPILTYSSGAAAGVFAPALSAGAAIGSLAAAIFHVPDHLHLLALCGMIGFLTGITRTPFTAFVLVLEMTNRHQAIFPMMLASMVAYGTSYLIDPISFYEHVKEGLIERAEHEESLLKAA